MNVKWMAAERSTIWASVCTKVLRKSAKRPTVLLRQAMAALLAVLLVGGPVRAQNQDPGAPPQQQPSGPQKPGLPTPQTPAQEVYTNAPKNPPIPVSLGVSKPNYRHAPRQFPNLIAPYRPIHVPPVLLTNSPRLDQLIHDNKLE